MEGARPKHPVNRGNSLGRVQLAGGDAKCEAGGTGFQDNFFNVIVLKNWGVQDVEIARGELYRKGPKMQSFWHRGFKTNSINAIVPKKCAPKTCEIDAKCWAM